MSIDLTLLRPVTRQAANDLKSQCPWVEFTSGFRTWPHQAHVMAVNSVKKRDWVGLTYKHIPDFQTWLDQHPDSTTVKVIEDAFLDILMNLPPDVRLRFAHPAARAFDCKCPIERRRETITAMKALKGYEFHLDGEGGLDVLHCQFHEADVVS